MSAIHARKKKIIAEFAGYRLAALTGGKFDLIRAHARFIDAHTLELSDGRKLTAKHILIGTGSKVTTPPIPGLAEAAAWTSDDVLDLDFVPKSVIVLGGGVVACELAQFLRRIGSRVTLVQRSPNILRDHSEDASCVVQKAFVDEGIELQPSMHSGPVVAICHAVRRAARRLRSRASPAHRSAIMMFSALLTFSRSPALCASRISGPWRPRH
jgi:pyruvate/2-oxoglutarate dehydrogenase complex dihydrolipoamide dehydrogenase (E3) component